MASNFTIVTGIQTRSVQTCRPLPIPPPQKNSLWYRRAACRRAADLLRSTDKQPRWRQCSPWLIHSLMTTDWDWGVSISANQTSLQPTQGHLVCMGSRSAQILFFVSAQSAAASPSGLYLVINTLFCLRFLGFWTSPSSPGYARSTVSGFLMWGWLSDLKQIFIRVIRAALTGVLSGTVSPEWTTEKTQLFSPEL